MSAATHLPVAYKCGHTEDRDLSDKPAGERARSARWYGEHLVCSRCFKKQQGTDSGDRAAREAKELAEATEAAERDGLPPALIGTEKQAAWALQVRHRMIRNAYAELVEAGTLDDADFQADVLEPAARIDRARWWIDNRDQPATDLPELLADPGTIDAGASTENVA